MKTGAMIRLLKSDKDISAVVRYEIAARIRQYHYEAERLGKLVAEKRAEQNAKKLKVSTDKLASISKSMKEKEDARRADLPAGACPHCDGEGEQGGQFCGGYWKCDACNGTGKETKP